MKQQELLSHFIENLEKERVRLHLTQAQMAEKLEMSTSNYKKLIAGQYRRPNLFLAQRLYELTGKLLFQFFASSSPELDVIAKLSRLSVSQRNFVEGIIDFELEFAAEHPDDSPDDSLTVIIPTGNCEDGMIWDSANIRKLNIAPYRKRYGSQVHIGVEITSNHLNPVYYMGDILLISRRPPRDGDTAIFLNKENGCAYLRRFVQQIPRILEPINGYGETFYIDPYNEAEMKKWIKYGIVLTKIRE
jgi:transcriptional regulator with XRE-family HTH domain